jgi:hypothetical protein
MKLLDCLDHGAGVAPGSVGRSEIQTLVDYFTAWNDHDIDAILGLLTDDATYDAAASPRSMSALRSATSSSPICRRMTGPSYGPLAIVRSPRKTGTARLS